jgi:hypothetical protein
MLIGDKYKVESDSLNVTLYKKEISRKTDVINWRAIAFFSTPQNALDFLVDLEVKETEMKDLAAVVKKQNELYDLINSLKGLPELLQSRAGAVKG